MRFRKNSIIFILFLYSPFCAGFIEGFFNTVRSATLLLSENASYEERPQGKENNSRFSRQINLTNPTEVQMKLPWHFLDWNWWNQVHFNLFDKITQETLEVGYDRKDLLRKNFVPENKIKFIVHGYFDSSNSIWPKKVASALADAGEFNIFIVDWYLKAHNPNYFQSAANTREVGKEVANFISFLQQNFTQVKLEDIHCIGHSLGSHVCGFAGKSLKGQIGRITGLDPAAPDFEDEDPDDRLDPSDAKFVDVIHTDTTMGVAIRKLGFQMGFGMKEPCGHMDFYPNNGEKQPGCTAVDITRALMEESIAWDYELRELAACDHHRAIYYFYEAVINYRKNTQRHFVGHLCDSYNDYLKNKHRILDKIENCGSCEDGTKCAIMGLEADEFPIGNRSLLKFYLTTKDKYPFFVFHYLVNLQLVWPNVDVSDVKSEIKIRIVGTKATLNSSVEDVPIKAGENATFIVQSSEKLGKIQEVKLEWHQKKEEDHQASNFTSTCRGSGDCPLYIERIQVQEMDVISKYYTAENQTLCGEHYFGHNYTTVRRQIPFTYEGSRNGLFDQIC